MNNYTLWQFIDDFKFCCKKHFSTTKNIYIYGSKINYNNIRLKIDYNNGLIILTSNDGTKIIINDKNNICYYNGNYNPKITFYFKCNYCDYYARYIFSTDEKSELIEYKSDKLAYSYNNYYYRNNNGYKKIDINIDLVTRESLEKIEDSLLFI